MKSARRHAGGVRPGQNSSGVEISTCGCEASALPWAEAGTNTPRLASYLRLRSLTPPPKRALEVLPVIRVMMVSLLNCDCSQMYTDENGVMLANWVESTGVAE